MYIFIYIYSSVYINKHFQLERKPQERNSASQFSDLLRSARIKSLEPRSLCNIVVNHRFSSAGNLCTATLLVADGFLHICLITIQHSKERSGFWNNLDLFPEWFFNAYKFFNRYVLFLLENLDDHSFFLR